MNGINLLNNLCDFELKVTITDGRIFSFNMSWCLAEMIVLLFREVVKATQGHHIPTKGLTGGVLC